MPDQPKTPSRNVRVGEEWEVAKAIAEARGETLAEHVIRPAINRYIRRHGQESAVSADRRRRLGQAVYARRQELQLTQEELAKAAGLKTRRTVGEVEAAQPVKRRTLWLLDTGLGWPPGTAERYLKGQDT